MYGVVVKESVDDYTWEELSKIAVEIAVTADEAEAVAVATDYNLCTEDGNLDGSQVKAITLANGVETTVQIIGLAHDNRSDGGKAGLTFMFGEAIQESAMDDLGLKDVEDGWKGSLMRAYLNAGGLSLLSNDLRERIVAVDKLTNIQVSRYGFKAIKTSDLLWLPSLVELVGESDWPNKEISKFVNREGSQYKMYRDNNVEVRSEKPILRRAYRGRLCTWWERSPRPQDGLYEHYYYCVSENGLPCLVQERDLMGGVVPGFCI